MSKDAAYRLISKYFKSGLPPGEFYRQAGISGTQFYKWRARYLQDRNKSSPPAKAAPDFHPIHISAPQPSVETKVQIELEYPNGVILRTEGTLSDARIASLIKLY